MVKKRLGLSDAEKAQAIASLSTGRSACLAVFAAYKFGSPEYLAAELANTAIMALADQLTGEADSLLPPPHSTPGSTR